MDLKDKQKIVKVIGAAETALAQLETQIHTLEAQGKTPAKADKQLLKSITHALDLLKTNPFAGHPVQHHLWPKEFKQLPNLFRMELSQFWRLLYYVAGDELSVIVVVFEICDHPRYDSIFGYKKQ
ncbi:type II toxin-antitoxin system RelE/ParE family toxin [Candidatus Woesearchaeota archaeon]|nr:type II toxin-antitoxin system RelE/ParE family toxin [Candidatus Woesearchaeota archaeon]